MPLLITYFYWSLHFPANYYMQNYQFFCPSGSVTAVFQVTLKQVNFYHIIFTIKLWNVNPNPVFNSKEYSFWLISISVTYKTWLFYRNSGAGKEHLSRCSGYDEINFNVVKKCFGELYGLLKFIFNLSLEKGIFSDALKIARVAPIFKSGDRSDLETLDQSQCSHAFPKYWSVFCSIAFKNTF